MSDDKKAGMQPESPEDQFERDIEELEAPTWRTNKTQLVALIILFVIAAIVVAFLATREKQQIKPAAPAVVSIDLIEPRSGKLSNTPTKFRWETVSGTKYYSFALTVKGGGSTLVQRAPSQPQLTLTPEEHDRLAKGLSYDWSVEAFSDVGTLLARGSGSFDL